MNLQSVEDDGNPCWHSKGPTLPNHTTVHTLQLLIRSRILNGIYLDDVSYEPDTSGVGYTLWSRVAAAAGSLTVNVSKAWAVNVTHEAGEGEQIGLLIWILWSIIVNRDTAGRGITAHKGDEGLSSREGSRSFGPAAMAL